MQATDLCLVCGQYVAGETNRVIGEGFVYHRINRQGRLCASEAWQEMRDEAALGLDVNVEQAALAPWLTCDDCGVVDGHNNNVEH
jgi:hypothetical protein